MSYKGGSLTSLFGAGAQTATVAAARRMAEKGGDRMVEITVLNTPIDTGNLRTSWYQIPTHKVHHVLGPAYESGVATDVKYAVYVEHGTGLWGPSHSKYPIRSKSGGMLKWRGKDGQDVFARVVMHPGSPGQHMVAIAGEIVEAETDGALFEAILQEWAHAIESGAD